jgi:hypothetical protein
MDLEERVEDLEGMVLALCHLAFDDEEHTAEDREELLRTDPAFRRRILEEQKHDLGHREMELEDRRGFRREPHPDLPAAEKTESLASIPVAPRPIPGPKPGR